MTSLNAFLQREQRLLVDRWLALVLASYPPEVARAFVEEADPFRNPVGRTMRESLEGLVGELLGDFDETRVRRWLDPVIRIRAVQCFAPSDAVGFVFGLKRVVRELAGILRQSPSHREELAALDDRIDRAALVACNLFSICRGQVAAIRAREQWRRRVGGGGRDPFQRRPRREPGDLLGFPGRAEQ